MGWMPAAAVEGKRPVKTPGHQRRGTQRHQPRQQRIETPRREQREQRQVGRESKAADAEETQRPRQ
jgi:hypothetical protein